MYQELDNRAIESMLQLMQKESAKTMGQLQKNDVTDAKALRKLQQRAGIANSIALNLVKLRGLIDS